jgi:eukaryotic-like serine/threonine-protein kinase
MATGQRPFSGNSSIAVLSSILRDDIESPAAVRADLPAELARIISRCLRKDPARRFQHTADLKVELEELKEESDSGKLAAVSAPAPAARSSRAWLWAALAVVLAVASFAAWRIAFVRPPASEAAYSPVPLTSYPGIQEHPSFSPDGNQIAFDWDGPKQDNFDIYVKLIGPGSPLHLTTGPAADIYPEWSPDGRLIAFLRMSNKYDGFHVIVIPALGGPERRVGMFANIQSPASFPKASLCWTPDSKALVVSAAEAPGRPNRLVLVPLDGGQQRVLTHPELDSQGDSRPAISSDGRQLVFVRGRVGLSTAFVLPLSASMEPEGEPRRIADKEPFVSHVDWLPGGREILFSAVSLSRITALYRISLDAGAVERIVPGLGSDVFQPAVAWRGNRLAYVSGKEDVNFWSVDLIRHT